MLNLLTLAVLVYLACGITWVLYLAVMNLKANQAAIARPAWVMVYPVVVVAIAFDIFINLVVGTVAFLEPPRELLFTARLQRLHAGADGWRKRLSIWVCQNLLNAFDPDKTHC